MKGQLSQLDERSFQKEQRILSSTLMHSLVNLTVKQHNDLQSINCIPNHLAVEISEAGFSGVDSLIRDAHQLMEFEKHDDRLTIELSFVKIEKLMKSIEQVQKQKALLIEYLQKGASTSCLHDLFHISKIQVVRLRKTYRVTTSASGRQDSENLFEAKIEYDRISTKNSDLKSDLLTVSKNLNIPLNTVWHAVRNPDYAEEVGGEKSCRKLAN
ncbi:STY4526/YPO1902 family pathogenicity island replication protein [Aliikangiella maris]|uniref:STY4526/YPO1902 family pathogenicity island replication protein n=2 Tax=Aliikangiella maris TaxID=3162458 RepID=A0ABV3MTS7_9GAMM